MFVGAANRSTYHAAGPEKAGWAARWFEYTAVYWIYRLKPYRTIADRGHPVASGQSPTLTPVSRSLESGPMAVPRSLLAVVFYGLSGVVVVLAALGSVAGTAANLLARQDTRRERQLILAFALASELVVVMVLAVLDNMVGKW